MNRPLFYDDAVFSGVDLPLENPRVTWKRRAIVSPSDIPPAPHNLPLSPSVGGAGYARASGMPGGERQSVADQIVVDAHRYASLIDLTIAVTTASVKFLDQPIGKRNFLMLRNGGANTIYIGFAGDASINSTLQIASGVSVLFDTVVPQDDLYVAGAGASSLSYAYSTFPG